MSLELKGSVSPEFRILLRVKISGRLEAEGSHPIKTSRQKSNTHEFRSARNGSISSAAEQGSGGRDRRFGKSSVPPTPILLSNSMEFLESATLSLFQNRNLESRGKDPHHLHQLDRENAP